MTNTQKCRKLPVIDVAFSHLVGMDACQGTLTLLDTPGPNEAGQPQMEMMMRDQLQKASAVLAVMDYTQMNSKADEEVRKELNAIADVSAVVCLCWSINSMKKIAMVMVRMPYARRCQQC
ncbi:hypothetical protein H6S20_21650 (plasmid) [Escherichia coli]|nr:hypothetical protein H6S20_21650 [Escherichia coli]